MRHDVCAGASVDEVHVRGSPPVAREHRSLRIHFTAPSQSSPLHNWLRPGTCPLHPAPCRVLPRSLLRQRSKVPGKGTPPDSEESFALLDSCREKKLSGAFVRFRMTAGARACAAHAPHNGRPSIIYWRVLAALPSSQLVSAPDPAEFRSQFHPRSGYQMRHPGDRAHLAYRLNW